jgi:hypothetical protein
MKYRETTALKREGRDLKSFRLHQSERESKEETADEALKCIICMTKNNSERLHLQEREHWRRIAKDFIILVFIVGENARSEIAQSPNINY